MSSAQALYACLQHPIRPASRFSRTIIRSIFHESIPKSVGSDIWRAAPCQALVSSPLGSFDLPNGPATDCFESLHERKLKEARRLLGEVLLPEKGGTSLESLEMVDALQRHGIAYHFEEEIQRLLHLVSNYSGYYSCSDCLYEVSLRFRLLRQAGYYVPSDIFEGFKSKDDNNGGYTFNPKLHKDIFGLMSLYEASHLCTHGEDVLDQAEAFSTRALSLWSENRFLDLDNDINGFSGSWRLREVVRNTLSSPFHKSLPRFTSESFQFYPGGPYRWSRAVRELATLDSTMVSSINRTEILQIYKWWKDLGLAEELKFARDQPLKWYMWPMAILPNPELSQERLDLTKPIAMVYIIDDIFDVYGSLDELTLFADAINRWECLEELPDYMKTCFRALDDITNEISFNVYKKKGWNPTNLLRKSWMRLCDAFLVEARWFTSRHSPSADEYLKNAIVSCGVDVVTEHSYALLCEGRVNEQSLDLPNSFSAISSSTAKILRLWDDLGSAEDENQEGHDGSYVDYYMKENPSCSLEGARSHVKEMISDSWKSLNQECLSSHLFFTSMAKASLNTARMVPLMYNYDQNHRLPRIEEYMKSLMLNGSA